MHPSLAHLSHRPWALPKKPWQWRQSWKELAFIHYPVDPAILRPLIPDDLSIQEFDGSAWIGIVPFRMADMMRGRLPSVPPMRSFPELNLRTYVEMGEKPGVWFFSLDADCWPIVWGGRALYGLPYHKARMSHTARADVVQFTSERRHAGIKFEARYRPAGPVFYARRGSFEHWATERYCLYSQVQGRTLRLEVHHPPWPLQRAEVEIRESQLVQAANLEQRTVAPICHFSAGVDVVSYSPEARSPLI